MQPWKTRSRRTILDRGKFLVVEEHSVELPDGRVIDSWPWVISPDFVNIVAVTPEGEFLCFRQTKYAGEGVSLSVVGGYIDEGEAPLTAAKRELLEETGYEADDWTALGCYAVDGNRGAGHAHFFLAQGARCVAEIDADDLEEQQLLLLSQSEVESGLLAGEFKLLPWAAIVGLALRHLDRA